MLFFKFALREGEKKNHRHGVLTKLSICLVVPWEDQKQIGGMSVVFQLSCRSVRHTKHSFDIHISYFEQVQISSVGLSLMLSG